MLIFLHTVYSKNTMESCWYYAAYRKQEEIKNADRMLVNHVIAIVTEFIFCRWPQRRMERLFLQLAKKNLTSRNKLPCWTITKHHRTITKQFLLFVPTTRTSETSPPLTWPIWIPGPPFTKGGGGGGLCKTLYENKTLTTWSRLISLKLL